MSRDDVAARVISGRLSRRISIEDAAASVGISHMTWRRIERGLPVQVMTYGAVDKFLDLPAGTAVAIALGEQVPDEQHDGAAQVSDRVASRLAARRVAVGMSREELAARCAELGRPELTFEAVSNIENGRRTDGRRRRLITVDELAVLEIALGGRRVPPAVGRSATAMAVSASVTAGRMRVLSGFPEVTS